MTLHPLPLSSPLSLPTLYAGYSELTEWAAHADPTRPALFLLMALPSEEVAHPAMRHVIVVSQADPAHTIHYCRIEVGRVALGAALDPATAATVEASKEARDLVAAWLVEQGFRLVPAAYSFPRDHIFLSGGASFLAQDEAGRWQRLTAQSG